MNEYKSVILIAVLKFLSSLGIVAAVFWFFVEPDFAAVLVGILSLVVFMSTFLPITTDQQV